MAQASIQDPLSSQAESSTAASILRNDDPLSRALRKGEILSVDDIARLSQAMSPVYETSSLGVLSAEVFSHQDGTTITKPTSTNTLCRNDPYCKGKGKGKVSYASSLSVAHGSGSEADAQQYVDRRDALLAMGEWVRDEHAPEELLKDARRTKKRDHQKGRPKHTKPVVEIIQHADPHAKLHDDEFDSTLTIAPGWNHSAKTAIRRRVAQHNENELRLAEEGQVGAAATQVQDLEPLSKTRLYAVISLTLLIVLTIALCAVGAHRTGKARLGCTKGIVFAATILVTLFTFLAVIIARRAPQEALLAGLLEIAIGFTLLVELNDFM